MIGLTLFENHVCIIASATLWKEAKEAKEAKEQKDAPTEEKRDVPKSDPYPEVERFKREMEKLLARDANAYEETRREVIPIIDALENDLREIFTERRARNSKKVYLNRHSSYSDDQCHQG